MPSPAGNAIQRMMRKFTIAALLLLVNDYQGYAGVLLAVGLAAAVNLR